MALQQRLIVCLDGTWNQQDSSTNVLHHFNLVCEGPVPGSDIVQRKYYHPGVGTNPLDRITGGGFGFGLEQNVRDAYNWLVQNYSDGDANTPADEIYIFGFSRGAYTARSLVGFIAKCGLLRHAAPLTVSELWEDYAILGRRDEQRKSIWDKLFKRPTAQIRPIATLVRDPWLRPATMAQPRTLREKLLIQWSRRVRITYLGIYDTVGAIGWDALAIPGLRSKIAMHNNLKPTTIIVHCRHALAVDENRSSFNHTPFCAFIGNDAAEDELERATGEGGQAAKYWTRTRDMWRRKIEQRWFVGAHSNIGGGYEDTLLAQTPLQWMLEGAKSIGLHMEPVAFAPSVAADVEQPRDSYEEFAPPLWTKLIRAKRNYRDIDPEPALQANVRADAEGSAAGFSIETINESVDQSVYDYWTSAEVAMPPNLFSYVNRHQTPEGDKLLEKGKKPEHVWLGGSLSENIAAVFWATCGAMGLAAIYALVGTNPGDGLKLWIACVVAFVLPFVDWSESVVNFRQALGRGGPGGRAFLDSIYWTRTFGFVLFLCGSVYSIGVLVGMGWTDGVWGKLQFAGMFWPVPLFAAAAVLVASGLRSKAAWSTLALGPAFTFAVGAALCTAGWFLHRLLLSFPSPDTDDFEPSVPGIFLLFQLSFVYLWRAQVWAADPMNKANLGSITALQRPITPSRVMKVLDDWQRRLQCRWGDEEKNIAAAAKREHEVVRETLWRDIFGFIPVYAGVFIFSLWFAASQLGLNVFGISVFDFLNKTFVSTQLWLLIPLAIAAADYLEDICHLRYVALHEKNKRTTVVMTLFSWTMSTLKGAGVIFCVLVTLTVILAGSFTIDNLAADWRGKIAILLSTVFGLALATYIIGRVVHVVDAPKTTNHHEDNMRAGAAVAGKG